jgi:hypothetical protein
MRATLTWSPIQTLTTVRPRSRCPPATSSRRAARSKGGRKTKQDKDKDKDKDKEVGRWVTRGNPPLPSSTGTKRDPPYLLYIPNLPNHTSMKQYNHGQYPYAEF